MRVRCGARSTLGCRQAVRHQTLTLACVGSNPAIPAISDPLAQLAEQLPFKQWVRGSNPRRVTKNSTTHSGGGVFACRGFEKFNATVRSIFVFCGGERSPVVTMRNRRGDHGAPTIYKSGNLHRLQSNAAQNRPCLFVYNLQRIPGLGLVYRAGLAFKIR